MKAKKTEPKPITARPVGSRFASEIVGLKLKPKRGAPEDPSLYQMNIGCFRRMPTCKD